MQPNLKKTLRALSLELRHILEGQYDEEGRPLPGDLERRLNALGIWRDRAARPLEQMPHLSAEDLRARQVVDAYIKIREEAGVKQTSAVAEFVREAAYTWANRLLALRCMEARSLIDEVVLQKEAYGGRSLVHNRFARNSPEACAGEDDGLFAMLFGEFAERARELPRLFHPEAPAVKLRPSVVALKRCVALLSGREILKGQEAASDALFEAPDALGWAYQYWNAEEKDRVFTEVRTKKGQKIEGADIIPATQLYTEPYMVKFLVQNSLGRTWYEMRQGTTKLTEQWEYFVRQPEEEAKTPSRAQKSVREITFLDPACGSGHFLLEAFDLFYGMYEEEGKLDSPEAICAAILNHNLYGIDIDERAVQIAAAALWMKALERAPNLPAEAITAFKDHLVATNIRLPKDKNHLQEFLRKYPEEAQLRPALETVFEGLQNAHELGSLLQIEEPVEKELRYLQGKADERLVKPRMDSMFEEYQKPIQGQLPLGVESFDDWKAQTLTRLKDHFETEAEAADLRQAFFGQDAGKGLALFDLLAKKYDILCLNPPFMHNRNISDHIRDFLSMVYPSFNLDLCFAFLGRTITLKRPEGIIGMVTQRSFFFTQHYTGAREIIFEKIPPLIFAVLGSGAFSEIGGEKVNVALSTFSSYSSFVSIYDISGSEQKSVELQRKTNQPPLILTNNEICKLPRFALLYNLDPQVRQLFLTHLSAREYMDVKAGLITCDNLRFLRFYWEINNRSRWYPYAKGGKYRKWYGNNEWCVDWEQTGPRIKCIAKERYGSVTRKVANESFYFREGVSFSLLGGNNISGRFMPAKGLYDYSGSSIFPTQKIGYRTYDILSWLNSRLISIIARELNPTLSFQVGDLALLPAPKVESITLSGNLAKYVIELIKDSTIEPLNPHVKELSIDQILVIEAVRATLESRIEDAIASAYGFEPNFIQQLVSIKTNKLAGWYPLIYGYEVLPILPKDLPEIPYELIESFKTHERKELSPATLSDLKRHLRALYEAGPGSKAGDEEIASETTGGEDEEEGEAALGARIPIPTETFLEELSVKLEIHPISVYWLLKEGREQEGWRCLPEERRFTEDTFTVMVLRLLGHRWPKQIEAGEPVPEWADADGIIPFTPGCGEPTLLERVHQRIAAEFPGGNVSAIEREFEALMGVSLEKWLSGPFFKKHISQFKKRPIAWQLESQPSSKSRKGSPAFACLVYYHKLDADLLPKIRSQYVGPLCSRYETELRTLEGLTTLTGDQSARRLQLTDWIAELKQFDEKLAQVAEKGFSSKPLDEIAAKELLDKWTSRDGLAPHPANVEAFLNQERRYNPDINDGVRVNIAPLQKAGLLSAEVIAKKDLDKAISDRAEWRSDERRWCRAEKLPKPGWWK
ncbi:MAG: BREX-1 system adenine-specific DNA-methyltransferase PglX [Chloroflexi bacterium]|nr:BREX-1 system adenine-specific DNA-methyltransferase PglX [Chloroflexota bacterium]